MILYQYLIAQCRASGNRKLTCSMAMALGVMSWVAVEPSPMLEGQMIAMIGGAGDGRAHAEALRQPRASSTDAGRAKSLEENSLLQATSGRITCNNASSAGMVLRSRPLAWAAWA
jgi:hypothetical protein